MKSSGARSVKNIFFTQIVNSCVPLRCTHEMKQKILKHYILNMILSGNMINPGGNNKKTSEKITNILQQSQKDIQIRSFMLLYNNNKIKSHNSELPPDF